MEDSMTRFDRTYKNRIANLSKAYEDFMESNGKKEFDYLVFCLLQDFSIREACEKVSLEEFPKDAEPDIAKLKELKNRLIDLSNDKEVLRCSWGKGDAVRILASLPEHYILDALRQFYL